jgi:hypothetical protein
VLQMASQWLLDPNWRKSTAIQHWQTMSMKDAEPNGTPRLRLIDTERI